MRFNTQDGSQYAVNLKQRLLLAPPGSGEHMAYVSIVGVYVGSPSVELLGSDGETLLEIPGPVVWTDGVPADEVTGESGNLVVRTENSAYEFDQEQRLVRRLAGTNDPTNPLYPDGEWRPYDRIEYLAVGHRALIVYPSGKGKLVSTVRDIHGTYIAPPATAE